MQALTHFISLILRLRSWPQPPTLRIDAVAIRSRLLDPADACHLSYRCSVAVDACHLSYRRSVCVSVTSIADAPCVSVTSIADASYVRNTVSVGYLCLVITPLIDVGKCVSMRSWTAQVLCSLQCVQAAIIVCILLEFVGARMVFTVS